MIIICIIKTIWRTFGRFDGIMVDGHDYVEQEDGSLICEICGKKD